MRWKHALIKCSCVAGIHGFYMGVHFICNKMVLKCNFHALNVVRMPQFLCFSDKKSLRLLLSSSERAFQQDKFHLILTSFENFAAIWVQLTRMHGDGVVTCFVWAIWWLPHPCAIHQYVVGVCSMCCTCSCVLWGSSVWVTNHKT